MISRLKPSPAVAAREAVSPRMEVLFLIAVLTVPPALVAHRLRSASAPVTASTITYTPCLGFNRAHQSKNS
jgi:hypothetical protein